MKSKLQNIFRFLYFSPAKNIFNFLYFSPAQNISNFLYFSPAHRGCSGLAILETVSSPAQDYDQSHPHAHH